MIELQTMIILIEDKYNRIERNTPEKMSKLILKEFNKRISENEILNFYGLNEDYERQSNQIEYGRYF